MAFVVMLLIVLPAYAFYEMLRNFSMYILSYFYYSSAGTVQSLVLTPILVVLFLYAIKQLTGYFPVGINFGTYL